MTLQSKVSWLILLAILSFSAIDVAAQRLLILPSFYALEKEEARKNMDRAVQAIHVQTSHLGSSTTDWAFWDDMYQYAQDQDPAFQEANLNALTLDSLKNNLLIIYNEDQQLLWGMLYDLENEQELSAPDVFEQMKSIRLETPGSEQDGVLLTSLGPMLISARPILTSNRQGPVRGSLVFGRFLDTAEISHDALIELHAAALGPQEPDPEIGAIAARLGSGAEPYIQEGEDVNRVYQILSDLNNQPALLLNVNVPRTISVKGENAAEFATISLLGAGLMVMIVLFFALRSMVLGPLKHLTDHVVSTGQNLQRYTHPSIRREDEIGILGMEYNRMVERLTETRKSLMEQSFQSGMAEVASAVLHNIGNILNSVNISCTLIMDQMRASRTGNVAKLAEMVAEPEGGLSRFLTEDPRGRQIPAYLASLAAALKEEQQLITKETESLQGQIGQIKDIVEMQQRYGRVSAAGETISMQQLLEDVIRVNADDLARGDIRVRREYQQVAPITLDKHKVLQILLNLMSNARHACMDGEKAEKTITIRIFSLDPSKLCIRITDNGIGISPEIMSRIFEYGFTTRKTGHGFGLHDAALAARELGGKLTAQSDGFGFGAAFTLELPFQAGDRHDS